MPASAKLTQFLTAPSKVANALDWKKLSGSVLALNISRDEIGLTLASHPSCNSSDPQEQLDAIPLHFVVEDNRKCLDSEVIASLNEVVQQHKVCGFVVHWPLQKEGRMGASCGRVLHTLDGLLMDSKTPILSNNRKFCLWDGSHIQMEHDDAFGRCPVYGRPSTTDADFVHVASREQYNQDDTVVVDVWNDFCRTHWPELSQAQPVQEDIVFDGAWLEDFEQGGAYLETSAL
jgi:RNase H-fold protein (predicted Holliday junction resolvase)